MSADVTVADFVTIAPIQLAHDGLKELSFLRQRVE